MVDPRCWVKRVSGIVLPKGKTASGISYCLDHECRLRVFLENGNVPMDNSACERAIRPFTIGRKNWVLINSVRGARASAVIYSLVETARLNGLNVYRYMEHLLTELPKLADDKGNIDTEKMDHCCRGRISCQPSVKNPTADEKISGDFLPPGE